MTGVRLDRLASLYVVHPLLGLMPASRRPRIAVLMYHSVSDGRRGNAHPYYETTTSPRIFEQQMRFLKEQGSRVTSLAEAIRQTEKGAPVAADTTVAITFDDGYRDFYTHAAPILGTYGFPATVFLPTAFIDGRSRTFNGHECLTWPEVRELHAAGVVFGSHTVSHRPLSELPGAEVAGEVRRSKETIEQELGAAIDSFAYPYAFPEHDGKFRRRLRSILEETGYRYGVTTTLGTVGRGDDRYFLKRVPVNDWDDTRLLRAKLEGGYDWLHAFQYATKMIKARVR